MSSEARHLGTRADAPRDRGFTLTELLIVIGIIIALAAIGLPMALRSYKAANRTRTQADLQAIVTALNAYKSDFGDYPRGGIKSPDPSVRGNWDISPATLCKALVGPFGLAPPPTFDSGKDYLSGDCVLLPPGLHICTIPTTPGSTESPTDLNHWNCFDPRDGAEGPGSRVRLAPSGAPQGKVWGPYLQIEKFNVIGCMMHDRDGNPILYYPARPGGSNIRSVLPGPIGGYASDSEQALYDARDGIIYFRRPATESDDANALRAIRAVLGDLDGDGRINGAESPATEGAFLLWTAGPDGLFGPIRPDPTESWTPTKREMEKCDDITNFIQ